jgi:toxin YoeB
MKIEFTDHAWEDFDYWMQNEVEMAQKIRTLLKDIRRNPFTGLGKPEPLKFELQGYWSRRTDREHRLVYKVDGKGNQQRCLVLQCRYHYQ